MADIRESQPTLENVSTGEGLALGARVEGEASSAVEGSIGFGFKDATGNVILPVVHPEGDTATAVKALPVLAGKDGSGNLAYIPISGGAVPVTFAAVVGDGKKARGTATGSATNVTVASLTLASSKTYENLDFIVSCFRDAIFQVILSDNATETIIAEALTASGQYSFQGKLQEGEITSGATGTQLLLIKAKNLDASHLSDFRAALSVKLIN
jgi:hypothetical protein